jgi:hypothetical protein
MIEKGLIGSQWADILGRLRPLADTNKKASEIGRAVKAAVKAATGSHLTEIGNPGIWNQLGTLSTCLATEPWAAIAIESSCKG